MVEMAEGVSMLELFAIEREGLYIQTRQVANEGKVNLKGYFTSQFICFSLDSLFEKKTTGSAKKSPFDQKYARTSPKQATAAKARRNRLLVSSFQSRRSRGGIIYLPACQLVLLIQFSNLTPDFTNIF